MSFFFPNKNALKGDNTVLKYRKIRCGSYGITFFDRRSYQQHSIYQFLGKTCPEKKRVYRLAPLS
jgi:hypothetical protein